MTKIEELTGRPIEGEIRFTTEETPKQDDPMNFIKLLDELLALDGVIEYKWNQYTPYWMDGEPCEFSVLTDYNAGLKIEFGTEYGGEAGDGYYESFSRYSLSEDDKLIDGKFNGVEIAPYENKVNSIVRALHSGRHDVWLKSTFGDHASVFARKDGFRIEYYEHD